MQMICAWQAYLNLLPHALRGEVDELGREDLQELRLRVGIEPELILKNGIIRLNQPTSSTDISFVINSASEYSPWSANTVGQGFITAQGGHRVGICGVCTVSNGYVTGISTPTSLCLRVARDISGCSKNAVKIKDSILIIGPPGSGKTTLLRDLIRNKANAGQGSIAVVDEREEIFPLHKGKSCFYAGDRTDILSGCAKADGIEAVLRSMNPEWIAVDEITAQVDAEALLHAGWCGVNLLATAHAGSMYDLRTRPVYQPLMKYHLFANAIVLQKDKSWTLERI
jgi:stage III sporulation protein AA